MIGEQLETAQRLGHWTPTDQRCIANRNIGTFTDEVERVLVRLMFTCDASEGVEEWVQCRKGTYKDPTYGPSPVEMVNVWANNNGDGTQYVEGYVKAATFKALN